MSDLDDWRRRHTDPYDLSSPLYSARTYEPPQPVPIDSGIDPEFPPWERAEFRQPADDLPPWAMAALVAGMCLLFLWAIGDHKAVFASIAAGGAFALLVLIGLMIARRRR